MRAGKIADLGYIQLKPLYQEFFSHYSTTTKYFDHLSRVYMACDSWDMLKPSPTMDRRRLIIPKHCTQTGVSIRACLRHLSILLADSGLSQIEHWYETDFFHSIKSKRLSLGNSEIMSSHGLLSRASPAPVFATLSYSHVCITCSVVHATAEQTEAVSSRLVEN